VDRRRTKLGESLGGSSVKAELWCAVGARKNFDIAPADASGELVA
jgi:hypothetical protein